MILFEYLPIVILAFLLEVVDASVGMGYGTILTPVLLIMSFEPLRVIPAVLVSQLAGDFLAAAFHHKVKNVNLSIGSKHFKMALILSVLSLIGSSIAVVIMLNLPEIVLDLYIGAVLAAAGLIVLATRNKNYGFSWTRLLFLGSLAAFNKGMSGGGYGPIVTSGQILAGVEPKSAIGIISFVEGITCVAAFLTYFLAGVNIDWSLSLCLAIGVALSTPLAALIVKKIESKKLRFIIGMSTFLLGALTIIAMMFR